MYSLNKKDFRYTAAERTKIMSSILLSPELLTRVSSEFVTKSGTELLSEVKEGKLGDYLVNWLDFPQKCFCSLQCTIIYRKDRTEQLPNYALIIAGDTNDNA